MMSLWLLLVVSWCGAASLQHIEETLETDSPLYLPHHPVADFHDQYEHTPFEDADFYKKDEESSAPYQNDFADNENIGFYKSDYPEVADSNRNRRWVSNHIDMDKTLYMKADNNEKSTPFAIDALQSLQSLSDAAGPEMSPPDIESKSKRNFSPWGGKRSAVAPGSEVDSYPYKWTWKRTPQSKESNMPKRVRFSPWGGKRSGNVIFKPTKTSRIIYTSLTPELWLQRFNTKSQKFSEDAFPFKTSPKKLYHLLKFKRGEYDFLKKNHLPFYDFAHNLNSLGFPKKDGKRKVKFSAWGGKRSPPVIGPVWSPSTDSAKDKLNTILLFGDETDKDLLPRQ